MNGKWLMAYGKWLVATLLLAVFLASAAARAQTQPSPTPQTQTQQNITGGLRNFFGEASPIHGETATGTSVAQRVGVIANTMILLVGMIFLIITVYSGITWMMAGGNEETIERSRKRIVRATIGLIIVVGAWVITNFVLKTAFGPARPSGGAVRVQVF